MATNQTLSIIVGVYDAESERLRYVEYALPSFLHSASYAALVSTQACYDLATYRTLHQLEGEYHYISL